MTKVKLKDLKVGDKFKLFKESPLTFSFEGFSDDKKKHCKCFNLETNDNFFFLGECFVFVESIKKEYVYFIVRETRDNNSFYPETFSNYKTFLNLSSALDYALSKYRSFDIFDRHNLIEYSVYLVRSSSRVQYDFDLPFGDDPTFSEDAYSECILDLIYCSNLDPSF